MRQVLKNPSTLLIGAVLFSVFIYGCVYSFKRMPSGDETISYLCATGNQGAYEVVNKHGGLYGKPSQAKQWHQFFAINNDSWQHIAADLTKTDLHPPLYFWLLYGFVAWIQPIFAAGLFLNFLLHLLVVSALYILGKSIGLDKKVAAAVVLIWCVSPAIISIGFVARQYELLCLINICAALSFIKFQQQKQAPWLLLFVLSLTAGVLTHYLYLYFIPVFIAYAVMKLKNKSMVWLCLLAVVIALVSLYLIHPGVINQFQLQQTRAQPFHLMDVPFRLGKIIIGFIQVVLPVMALKTLWLQLPIWAVLIGVMLASVLGFILIKYQGNQMNSTSRQQLITNPIILWLCAWSLGLAIIPYLLFFTPKHAMGGQYLVLVYPFLLLVVLPPLMANAKLNRVMFPIFLFGVILQLTCLYYEQKGYSTLYASIEQADVICVNSTDRRGFMRLVPYLKPNQIIIMDEQVKPCELSYGHVLFISDQVTKANAEPYFKQATAYDLHDGVVFYTSHVNPSFCGQLHGK